MSIINQMLKDLEQQRLQAEPAAIMRDVHMPGNTSVPAKTGMLVLIAGVFIAACSATWFLWDHFYLSGGATGADEYTEAGSSPNTVIAKTEPVRQLPAITHDTVTSVKTTVSPDTVHTEIHATESASVPVQQRKPEPQQQKVMQTTALQQLPVSKPGAVARTTSPPVKTLRSPPPVSPAKQPVKVVTVTPLTVETRALQKKTIVKSAPQPVNKPVRIEKSFRPTTPAQQAQQLYLKALDQLHAGKVALAEQTLHAALAQDKGHIAAREQLAALLLKQQRYDALTSVLLTGIQEHPEHSPFVQMYARLLLDQGLTAQAIRLLEGFRADVKSNPEHYAMLAAAYQRSGQHAKATQTYRYILAIQPQRAVWWMGMAISLEALHDNPAALAAFRRAQASQRLRPELSRFVSERIRLLEQQG